MRGIPPFIIVAAAFLGLGGLVAIGGIAYFVLQAWFGIPLFATGPTQPVAFPHTVHAGAIEEGGLGLECTFCHRNVEKGAAATIPSVQQCMFCHSKVTGSTETALSEIGKFRGLDEAGNPLAMPLDPLAPIDSLRIKQQFQSSCWYWYFKHFCCSVGAILHWVIIMSTLLVANFMFLL